MIALRDDDGQLQGFGKILRNRTDLREQFDTLRNRVESADESGRRKDAFISMLAHELRNHLAPLYAAAHVIRTIAGSPKVDYPLRVIDRQLEGLRRLVDDLLDLSRIGTGKIDLILGTVSLHDVVTQAIETMQPLICEREHSVEVLFPPTPMLVEADASRLEQVFVNLINNAAKYTPRGGHIWIEGAIEDQEAVVHVMDNGVGIPHEMLPRIFDLFTQVEAARSRSEGGLGIGLSLVKNLVTMHGGSVQVRSDGPGRGSEFTVRLPLKPSS
jgi:signal transduction histidine kinase